MSTHTTHPSHTIPQDASSKILHQPHDSVFKVGMSDPHIAIEIIEGYLPKKLVAQMDFSTLTRCNTEYIDTHLRNTQSDILYKLRSNERTPCWIYLLFEHQSTYDARMPLRIFRYMCRIMETHQGERGKDAKLPIVIPTIVYNGPPSKYESVLRFSDAFENPAMAKKYMFHGAHIVNIHAMTDEQLLQHEDAAIPMMLLKHLRDTDFLETQRKILPKIAHLYQKAHGKPLVSSFLHCIMEILPRTDMEALSDIAAGHIDNNDLKGAANMQTIAQYLREEGHKVGHQEGHQEGRRLGQEEGRVFAATHMLQDDMPPADVARILRMTEQEIRTIQALHAAEGLEERERTE